MRRHYDALGHNATIGQGPGCQRDIQAIFRQLRQATHAPR